MGIRPREYQSDASDAVIEAILFNDSDDQINPIVVMPPGTGKSVLPVLIIEEFLTKKPEKTVLVLSHVAEILTQNHKKLVEFFDGHPIGLYSAQMGIRQVHKITVASIQSVFRKPELFGDVGLIIVDECHLVTYKETGMYRKLFKIYPKVPIVGLTASPWWTGRGSIINGQNAIFNKIVYDMSTYENFNFLIDQGYLVPLIPLPTDLQLDTKDLPEKNGDFDDAESSKRFNIDEINDAIVAKTIKYGKKKYKKWIIFAIDIKHCLELEKRFIAAGIAAEAVYTGSKRTKEQVLPDLADGTLRAVINANMLTTGIDIPEVDLIVFARPSKSPIFHMQANGRGDRPVYVGDHDLDTQEGRLAAIIESGKTHCLVLDFAGNTSRLGPINGIVVPEKGDKKKGQAICSKPCKNCGTENHLRALTCIACDEDFEFEIKLKTIPDTADIIKREPEKKKDESRWFKVRGITYGIHKKQGAPDSLLIEYNCGMTKVAQWVCIDHKGYAYSLAKNWIRRRVSEKTQTPKNLLQLAIAIRDGNMKPINEIHVQPDGKFYKILDSRLNKDFAMPKIIQNFQHFFFSNKMKNKTPEIKIPEENWDDDVPF